MPTPIAAVPVPIAASPAPINLAAAGSIATPFCCAFGRPVCCSNLYSVARVKSVSEIDASEDGEHIGLEDRNEQLKCSQYDRHNEWQRRKNRKQARAKQAYDEAAHDFQRDVAGEHVGEKTDGKAHGTGKEGDDF